ncbi:MAG: ATP-dependent sacrificial sulfur transferase LarE [Caloramator sp.]|nr:ATP-dependent sacrificial sulfur transferase LarE [Caloramator sp.]
MNSKEKYMSLVKYLEGLDKVLVAFSGGVDSTFLLKAAKDAIGESVLAVTFNSPYIPSWEVEEAKKFTKDIGVKHLIINMPIINEIKDNPENRCYLCKKAVFTCAIDVAKKENIKYVLDGTNADDTRDYRPGMKALKELDIKSPLLELGFTKEDIRLISKEVGLLTWDKPAYACLLSRIPYGEKIETEKLKKIEKSEMYLMSIGFKGVRVRSHEDIARIEAPKNQRFKFLNDELLDDIVKNLKGYGFKYVTLDLEGYRTGSLNETIENKNR